MHHGMTVALMHALDLTHSIRDWMALCLSE